MKIGLLDLVPLYVGLLPMEGDSRGTVVVEVEYKVVVAVATTEARDWGEEGRRYRSRLLEAVNSSSYSNQGSGFQNCLKECTRAILLN